MTNEYAFYVICISLSAIFLVMALLFAILKEKAAMLIGSFTRIPKEQRDEYDRAKIAVDRRNNFLLWAIILFVGSLLSSFVSYYFALAAIAVWLFLVFKNVHFFPQNGYQRYRK